MTQRVDPAVRGVTAAVVAGGAIMAAGLIIAALARLPLTWDGAWFLVHGADSGAPTFLFRRAIHAVLQAPSIVVAAATGDVGLASLAFSMGYVAVPIVALWAAWRVVRSDRPELIIWPVLAICLVALPGQAFFVTEGVIVANLAWALGLAAVLGTVGRHRAMVVILAVAIAISHPFGGPTLVAVGLAGAITRSRHVGADGPRASLAFVAFGVAVTVAAVVLRSRYEVEASSIGELASKFRASILDPATVAPVAAWLVGALAFLRLRPSIRLGGVILILGVAAVILLGWALDPVAWTSALRYRAWYVIMSIPLATLAILDVWRPAPWRDRRLVVIAAPLVMSVVLGVQGIVWVGLQRRLEDTLAASPTPCVTGAPLAWVHGTPLDHWSVTSLALIVEGRDPTHLALLDRACADAFGADGTTVTIKVTPFDRDDRPVDGWWGFERLVASWDATH